MEPVIKHSGDPRVGVARQGGVVAVLPVISEWTAEQCVASILRPDSSFGVPPGDVLIVDNTRDGWAHKYRADGFRVFRDPDNHNLGVARAWNVAARDVVRRGVDYLLIVSTAMLFGPALHTTWLEQMERFWDTNVIEASGHSWHLIAIHRRVFEAVGFFDTNLYPAYWEAGDFSRRMKMLDMEGWPTAWVNAMSIGYALHNEVVSCPAAPLLAYMEAKWGGPTGAETFDRPWGDKPLDHFEDVPIPVLAERYGLGEYGTGWW